MNLFDILIIGGLLYLLNVGGTQELVSDVQTVMNDTFPLPHKVLERGICLENVGFQCD